MLAGSLGGWETGRERREWEQRCSTGSWAELPSLELALSLCDYSGDVDVDNSIPLGRLFDRLERPRLSRSLTIQIQLQHCFLHLHVRPAQFPR